LSIKVRTSTEGARGREGRVAAEEGIVVASFSLICVGRMWKRVFWGGWVWRRRVVSWGKLAEIWRGVGQKRKGFCPKCPGVLGEERGESWAKRGTLSAVSPFPLGGLFSS
jgi:hypothetical protein